MSFLAPWFLLGGLAIAGPILFHLIRRVTRDRVLFSSTRFLRPVAPKVTRRRRIQHWILLLLRCACILLIALAFARPFLRGNAVLPPIGNEARQILLLVDTSASMQRDGVWDRVRAVATAQLSRVSASDELAIVTFDREPRTVLSFEEWKTLPVEQREGIARERLSSLEPGWKGTRLGPALTFSAEQFRALALAGNAASQREIVLISDLQEGGRLDGLQGYDWPAGMNVVVETAAPRRVGNAGIAPMLDNRQSPDAMTTAARLVNSRDSSGERFRVHWKASGGNTSEWIEAYVPPGQIRTLTRPSSNAVRQLEVELAGDPEIFDNRAWFVLPEAQHVRIAWLGVEGATDPDKLRFYFERAFPATARERVEVAAVGNNEPVTREQLDESPLVVVPRSLNAAETGVVREWLANGGSGLLVLTDDQMGETVSALSGVAARVSEASGNYSLLSGINFSHPLFVPFADPRFSDFTRIHFWKHRRLDLPAGSTARVLAKFDDESPALIEFTVGKGALLVWTSGWNPADSQLAVASKFAPLMQTTLAWARAVAPSRHQFITGDAIPSPAPAGNPVQWRLPNGKTETGTPESSLIAEVPGFYSATAGGKDRVFAVNLPADESRTAPMPLDVLARLGVPMGSGVEMTLAQRRARVLSTQRAELENEQKLWRWCLVGALGMILTESLLSGWLARRESRAHNPANLTPTGKPAESTPARQEEFA
ncbi:MAG TPA: BatA domain-containing protein [Verrucomicrobiae bacterium]|nr:BatA domain-containing protein [Verrucomicrobiae bacterium]